MQKTSAEIEKKDEHTVYIGSLIKGYIQFHLTPRLNPLTIQNQLQDLVVVEPLKKRHTQC